MAGRDISLNIALQAAQAIADAERLKSGLEGVDDALEGTKTAGQQMADGLSSAAQDFSTEIEQAKRFADELGQALGPELSAQLGQSGLDEYAAALSSAGMSGDELSAFARSIPGELAAGEQAARDLGRALGPELSAQLGQAGLEDIVGELHTAGLAFEDISQDADALGSSIRQLDGVRTGNLSTGLDTVATSTRKAGGEADRTRNIFSNMVGNSVGQLTGFSGALGPLAQGLGDVADEAVRGGVNIKEMAVGGGALAGVGIAVALIADKMKESAEATALAKEQIAGFVESIRAGGDPAGDLASRLEKAGNVEFKWIGGSGDATEAMDRVGLSAERFSQLAIEGQPAINAYKNKLDDLGFSGKDVDTIFIALSSSAGQYAKAQGDAAVGQDVFRATTESASRALDDFIAKQDPIGQFPAEFLRIADAVEAGATPSIADLDVVMSALNLTEAEAIALADRSTSSLEGQANAAKIAAGGVEILTDALRDQASALNEQLDAQRSAVDAGYALADSQDAFAVATLAATTAMNNGTPGEQAAAYRDLAQSAQTVADAQLRVATESAAADGQTLSATRSLDIQNDSLLTQASTLTGPLRQGVLNHIAALNEIPPSKLTRIEALLEQGKLGEAKRLLDDTSKTRKVALEADAKTDAADRALGKTARDRALAITAGAVTAAAEGNLNRTARDRALKLAASAVTASAEGNLNRTARDRALRIAASAVTAGAEGNLNRTARNRALNIAATALTAGAEGQLNRTARNRALDIAVTALTAGAESDLNETARNRDTLIDVATTAAAAGAAISGVANANYSAVVNVTASGIGAVQSAIAGLKAAAIIRPLFE